MKNSLEGIKSRIDKIEFTLKNPIQIIQEHCVKQRNQIDLKVEELIKRLNEIRDDLFQRIETFEKESITSLECRNESSNQNIKDFLNETNRFHEKWKNYLSNLKISEDQVSEAKQMAKIYKNKIPVFMEKTENFVFNGKCLEFHETFDLIDPKILGDLKEKLFEKIVIDQEELASYKNVNTIYDFKYFDDNKVLIAYTSNKMNIIFQSFNNYTVQINDDFLKSITSKLSLPIVSYKENPYCGCTFGENVLFYYYTNSMNLLVQFDKDFKELIRIKLQFEVKCLTSNENLIFILSNQTEFCVHVMDKDFNILHGLGQTESPNLPFYFQSQIKKILVRNKKFYCLYPNKVEIIDQQSGDRLKVIDTKSELIKMDNNGNVYLLDRENSMIVIYDYNGDFLHQVELINLPENFNFSFDKDDCARFILNSNKISKFVYKLIPDC